MTSDQDRADMKFWLKDAASILRQNGTVTHAEWVEKASRALEATQSQMGKIPREATPEMIAAASDTVLACATNVRGGPGFVEWAEGGAAMIYARMAAAISTPSRIEAGESAEEYKRRKYPELMGRLDRLSGRPTEPAEGDLAHDGTLCVRCDNCRDEHCPTGTSPECDFAPMSEAMYERLQTEGEFLAEAMEVLEKLKAAGLSVLSSMDDYNAANNTHLGGPAFFEMGRAIHSADTILSKAEREIAHD